MGTLTTEATTATERSPGTGTASDFDLHGLVGIRALDAGTRQVAALSRQLGLRASRLTREPDVVIRFVERLDVAGPVRFLNLDDAAFDDEGFLVRMDRHHRRARVRFPFENLGSGCEITCEHGVGTVPLLVPLVNLLMLSRGHLPLHASAFAYHGAGILVAGWAKGGKTETLLAFAANGATYVGDEWVYVGPEGRQLFGMPMPIRIWQWHLSAAPEYWARLERRDVTRLRLLRRVQSLTASLPLPARVTAARARLLAAIERQLHVDMPPQRLFDGAVATEPASFDHLVFVMSHDAPDVRVAPVAATEVAHRMRFSLQYERLGIWGAYLKFRFAFPDRRCPLLEGAEEMERDLLKTALAGKRAHVVYHPYPVPIRAMFDAVVPLTGQFAPEGL